jgi:hypothetical protein
MLEQGYANAICTGAVLVFLFNGMKINCSVVYGDDTPIHCTMLPPMKAHLTCSDYIGLYQNMLFFLVSIREL